MVLVLLLRQDFNIRKFLERKVADEFRNRFKDNIGDSEFAVLRIVDKSRLVTEIYMIRYLTQGLDEFDDVLFFLNDGLAISRRIRIIIETACDYHKHLVGEDVIGYNDVDIFLARLPDDLPDIPHHEPDDDIDDDDDDDVMYGQDQGQEQGQDQEQEQEQDLFFDTDDYYGNIEGVWD
jgi:hypothetical protein